MNLQSGVQLGHYEILDLVGRGGMGEVWRARDARLKREVALKVLPAAMSSNPQRLARFQQEAETVARLSHPNIVTLYSVEEVGGLQFLTMELIRGRSLDTLLKPDGLPLDEVLPIGIAVAEALAAAHEKHVVHRDLKPANIVVGEANVVKVLDFGLAKLTDLHDSTDGEATNVKPPTTTSEGTVLGTVAYMSPEQARGKEVDHRTDIFSLGVVLYELLIGRRPFQGETPADVTSAILREIPPFASDIRNDIPRELARLVARCLEKDPARRIQSARDARNELEAIRDELRLGTISRSSPLISRATVTGVHPLAQRGGWTGVVVFAIVVLAVVVAMWRLSSNRDTPAPQASAASAVASQPVLDRRTIAVLPFADMSQQKDQEYFSDGISEEILNILASIPELRVTSRSSSFSFKGKNTEIREIARALQVAHVLEGSVRKSGNKLRITAQLIDAASDTHLWSETWDREAEDVFAVQDEIAADVAQQLKLTLLRNPRQVRKTTPEAYALYLKALAQGRLRTPASLREAETLLRQVLEHDRSYTPAWVALAQNYLTQVGDGSLPILEGYDRAHEAATQALSIDARFADAYAPLVALAIQRDHDLVSATQHLQRGLAIDPANRELRTVSAMLMRALGRGDELVRLREESARLDPLGLAAQGNLATSLLNRGRFDEAIAAYQSVLRLQPKRGATRAFLALALILKGDPAAGLAEIEQESNEFWKMSHLPLALHALGRHAESDEALAALEAKFASKAAVQIAEAYAFRGNGDEAFAWLEKAAEVRDPGVTGILNSILLKPLRDDRRWGPFLKKLGRDPETLAKISFTVPPLR